ncbi:MAG: cyclase family protein [Chitinophagaceae bacterium]|nr:cyclase family protein [Chitinophagaceae bacterium]
MKKSLYCMLLLAVSCTGNKTEPSLSMQLSKGTWIDLTYSFSEETLYWPTADKFRFDTVFVGVTPAGFYYEAFNFCAAEHGGTHLDAPVHFAKGKWTADQIPLGNLTGEAVVIDVSANALKNPDYQITVADMETWEKINGSIPDDAILLFRTGYGSFYPDAKKYLGTDERGAEAVAKLHFPGIHPDAATWLATRRKIKAVGLDVASVDYGQSKDFKTHQLLYEKNICGFENVANLDKLPATGVYIIALPMKIKNGSGGPLRIMAWVKK